MQYSHFHVPFDLPHYQSSETDTKETALSLYTSHLLLLGKFEYTGGLIFKVVLEC